MNTRFFSRIGRRETVWGTTITIVPTVGILLVVNQPISGSGYGVFLLLFFCYYLSAIFVGDRIINYVLRHDDSLLASALTWAVISHIISVAFATTIISFFTPSSIGGDYLPLGLMIWYAELLIGVCAALPMIVAVIYYWKQLKKIKYAAIAASSESES